MPEQIAEQITALLTEAGYQVESRYDEELFGNYYFEAHKAPFTIILNRDRGIWDGSVGKRKWKQYPLKFVSAYASDPNNRTGANELLEQEIIPVLKKTIDYLETASSKDIRDMCRRYREYRRKEWRGEVTTDKESLALQKKLNQLFFLPIADWEFSLEKKTLRIELTEVNGDRGISHVIIFKSCSAVMWMNDSAEPIEWDFCEFDTIDIGHVVIVTKDKWLKQFPGEFNVAIEIWTTALLINAKSIEVDGECFELN